MKLLPISLGPFIPGLVMSNGIDKMYRVYSLEEMSIEGYIVCRKKMEGEYKGPLRVYETHREALDEFRARVRKKRGESVTVYY
jgi:hypothetical protein